MKQATVKLPSGTYTIAESDKNGVVIFGTSMIGWQLLGADPTALTEVEAGEIVESWSEPTAGGDYQDYYKNYLIQYNKWLTSPTASLDSLAESLGVSKPYVVLKNVEK